MPHANADFITHHWENSTSEFPSTLQFDTGYYQSSTQFNREGILVRPTPSQGWIKTQSNLTLGYNLTQQLSLMGRLCWASVHVKTNDPHPKVGFGLADQSIGLNYRTYPAPQSLLKSVDLQIQTDFPAYQAAVPSTATTPSLGDGTLDTSMGLFATLSVLTQKTYTFNTVLGAGYTYRTAQFSSAIPWWFSIQYSRHLPSQKGVVASLSAGGFISLKTDPHLNWTQAFTGNANPSLLQLSGSLKYPLRPEWDLLLTVRQSMMGQNAPNGVQISGGLKIQFGTIRPPSLNENQIFNPTPTPNSLEAHILKSNDRMNLVKIDKGRQDGIEVGQSFEIFSIKWDGSVHELIARGQVLSVRLKEAALTVTDFDKEVWIEEGFLAKRLDP